MYYACYLVMDGLMACLEFLKIWLISELFFETFHICSLSIVPEGHQCCHFSMRLESIGHELADITLVLLYYQTEFLITVECISRCDITESLIWSMVHECLELAHPWLQVFYLDILPTVIEYLVYP